jgi:hypothetical protein
MDLFDHLVGVTEQRGWNVEAERLGALRLGDTSSARCFFFPFRQDRVGRGATGGWAMITGARIVLIALTFAATQVLLASTVVGPAYAQKEKSQSPKNAVSGTPPNRGANPERGANPDRGGNRVVAPTNPQKKKFEKPADAINPERNCGNNQCVSYWNELTAPHDGTYQGRLKAQKAYNDCMNRCKAASRTRR